MYFIYYLERANLVTIAVRKLEDTGAQVISIVCDAPAVHQSLLKELGADLSSEGLNPTLNLTGVEHPIEALLDNPHSIKNIRNSWESLGTMYNSDGEAIKWEYLKELYNVQSFKGIVLANKLNANHIFYHNQKQKVCFATQVFSNSCAKGLKYMREVLHHPKFEGSKATEEFLLVINNAFDTLNSRGYDKIKMKSWLGKFNKNLVYHAFSRAENVIRGLQDENGNPIINSRKRIGFVAMLLNILAVKNMYKNLIETGKLKYLATWFFNQDSLENFFSCVRGHYGSNNNPTASQFSNMYRRLLLGITGNIAVNVHSNVMVNSQCELAVLGSTTAEKIDMIVPLEDQEETDDMAVTDLYLPQYEKDIASYIGGYVVRRLEREVHCPDCTAKFRADKPNGPSLTSIKDNGGLIYTCDTISKIFNVAEKHLKASLNFTTALSDKNFIEKNTCKIQSSCLELIHNLPEAFDEHFSNTLRRMIQIYICIRCKHFSKDYNTEMKKNQTRQKMNRITLFRHF